MRKIIFLMLFVSVNFFAQKHELSAVTIQELQEKTCPMDSSATAAILFSVSEVNFDYNDSKGFMLNTTVKTKIKIYKKEGYDWANKVVKYYVGGNTKEKISFKNEVTYNLVNGKIEKTKIKSDGEFDEKVNDFWARKKIVMPNVKEGSIVEFEYTITSESIGSLDKWNFQSSIPVLYSEYTTFIPEYFTYKPLFSGFLSPKLKTDYKSRNLAYSYKEDFVGGLNTGFPQTIRTNIQFNEYKNSYTLENIPALKEESYVNNITNYIASVEHELESIKYPNQPYKNYATDWETVVKKIFENDNFGNELNKTGYFENEVDQVLAKTKSQEEKIAAIFYLVKSKMNWNNYYGYSCNNGVKKAYQEKTGNVAEINLMLTSMLRYAGFEANPILLSTRGNGISLYPSRTAFDYVISGVELNKGIVLLDATNKHSLPNILPIRDLNWFGRLIRKNGTSTQIDLMPKFNSKDIVNLMAEINEKGEISGKVRRQYFEYNAFSYRDNYSGFTKESMLEKIEKKHKGLDINEYEVLNNLDLSNPIIENYSFTNNNVVEIIGDKMYFSPFLHFALNENPFKLELRLYPIDFVFPNQDKYNISIKIPEGYVVETLPTSKAIGMENDLGNFKYNISSNENKIQLMFTFDINTSIINADRYEEVKAFFKELILKQTEKVVLKKI